MSDTEQSAAAETADAQPDSAPQPAASPQAEALRGIWQDALHAWWVGRIHNSPVSRNTEGVNHLDAVMPELLDELISRLPVT